MWSSTRDNWERLVTAVVRRQQLWELCHQHSRTPSVCSESSLLDEIEDIPMGDDAGVSRVPRMVPRATEGEQVAAGWPSWLAAAAGEAIRGWVPRNVDSFNKLAKIGQGTYSNVYLARDCTEGKLVALKKVRADSDDPESVCFMAREILILRRLDHPNVIKLEGLCTSRMRHSLYLVLEYMDHDLSGLVSHSGLKFTEPQVKCYMRQLLQGLDHCHGHGVLHLDLKGCDILINNNGVLKIADFSLATFNDDDRIRSFPTTRHHLTSLVATPWYRPPELLLGATYCSAAVDLWSTGCILAELYAGKPIMQGKTEVEQLSKIFELCGSPSEEYWKKSKLPRSTAFKPKQTCKRQVAEVFKYFPAPALALIEVLLSIDPADRGSAASALESEFFSTKPHPCDISSLPKYPSDRVLYTEAGRASARIRGRRYNSEKQRSIIPGALPAPDANADPSLSIQVGKGPRANHIFYSGPLLAPAVDVNQMLREHDFQMREAVRRARLLKGKGKLPVEEASDASRFYSSFNLELDDGSRGDQNLESRPWPIPSVHMYKMLKEHNRQISEAVRRARQERIKTGGPIKPAINEYIT